MPGIVEVPVATKQYGNFVRAQSKEPAVFDEPLNLVLPRATILLILWVAWTFFWAGAT